MSDKKNPKDPAERARMLDATTRFLRVCGCISLTVSVAALIGAIVQGNLFAMAFAIVMVLLSVVMVGAKLTFTFTDRTRWSSADAKRVRRFRRQMRKGLPGDKGR